LGRKLLIMPIYETSSEEIRPLIIVPTYNEQASIEIIIRKLTAMGIDYLISDGRSTDNTISLIQKHNAPYFIREYPDTGYGAGINRAMAIAEEKGYNAIVLIDCDDSYPIDQIPMLIRHLDKYDLVIGVRQFQYISTPVRKLGNIFFRFLTNFLYDGNYADVLSGMRAFRLSKFKDRIDNNHFGWIPHMNCIALIEKMKIKEVPITYSKRLGDSKLKFRDGVEVFRYILKEKLNTKKCDHRKPVA